jgi:hypothetical protein
MHQHREGNVNVTEIGAYIVAPLLAALNGVLVFSFKSLHRRIALAEKTSTQIKDNYISRFEKVHDKIGQLNTDLKVELATTKGEILAAIGTLRVEMSTNFVPKGDCDKNCERVIAELAVKKPGRRGR